MQLHQDAEHTLSKRFRIKRLLGKGSFGNVYECQEKKTNEVYAIKIISKIHVKRSKIQCLKQQATLLLSLDHPNIVKVYEFFQDQKVMFIKMEFVRYGTLGQLMKERQKSKDPFTDEETALVMGSIFRAVHYIHSLSILHRDIKPQNILIHDKNELGKLKIADFGLGAKLQFRSPTATSKCGTYLFMAPQIMWNYTYTKAVDIWSCAIIMYMLKKGSHPFYEVGMTNDQFKQKIKSIVFPPLDDLNPQVNDNMKSKQKQDQNIVLTKKKALLAQDLITRISKLSPNERYTAQDAIKHPWITRNFEDEIPLSLHDSFSGFQVSHQISLMMKMFLVLKNIGYKKETNEKVRKSELFQRYSRHCEQVNRKDRSVSPLKIRRLSSVNTTREIRELCQLSELTISPKKSKQPTKSLQESSDPENPTIMKLNKIFNNLFDKKQKKTVREHQSNDNQVQSPGFKCYEYSKVPDISNYKQRIEKDLEQAVKERHKRKKQRILPTRKKNQYGELIGNGCEVKKCFGKEKQTLKDAIKFQIDLGVHQINLLNASLQSNDSSIGSIKAKTRRKLNSSGSYNISSHNPHSNKFIT